MKILPKALPRFAALSALLVAAQAVLPTSASAQTLYFWTGTAGGANWSTPANWNNVTQGGATATTAPGNAANDSVTINQGSGSATPVTLNNTATTTIGSFNLGTLTSSSAYLQITGTGTKLKPGNAAGYVIGSGTGSTVGLTIKDGGELDYSSATSLGLATGTNASVTIDVGNGSTSTGAFKGAGSGATTFASKAGSVATLNINNGGSATFASNGAFNVGSASGATGNVNVASGGQLNITGAIVIGQTAGAAGNVTVGGGLLTTGSAMTLGNSGGIGTVTLSSGTLNVGTSLQVNAGSTLTANGGALSTGSGAGLSTSGAVNIGGALVQVGTGFTQSAGVVTMSSGTLIGVTSSAKLQVSGSFGFTGGLIDFSTNTAQSSSINSGTLTQTSGTLNSGQFYIGNSGTGSYAISGGLFTSAAALNIGNGTGGNGVLLVSGGTVTVAAGAGVGNGAAVTGGILNMGGGSFLVNSGNGTNNTLSVGTNSGTGSAGIVNLQGGTIAAAAGATNGFNLVLATPTSITSGTAGSSIQGYGTITLGSSGTKSFNNGGKVIASGANLISNTGATPTDHTLDLTGSTFNVIATANRGAGAGWYAVNHGQLSMNVSGTASATTLNWGAPSGTFTAASLVNSAQLTFATAVAPTTVTISLLASDRSDIAALWSQAGLPAGAGSSNAIGIWNITNNSGGTWNGLTLRYDDAAVTPLQTLALYYIPDASGSWTLVSTTIDSVTNFTVAHSGSPLSSGYYALIAVPEPNIAGLFAIGGVAVLASWRLRQGTRLAKQA